MQKLTVLDKFIRFFVAQTISYPGVSAGWFGNLKRAFTRLKWEQHHAVIQQSWFRPGSNHQWYPTDILANEGLRRLGNAGMNLIAIPRVLNNTLGKTAIGTASMAAGVYGSMAAGVYHIYNKVSSAFYREANE